MSARIRSFDWASTPLGPLSAWPVALRITVDQMLASKIAACLFWGEELIAIHNDAFSIILADKPALGRPMRDTWAEVWSQIEPIARKALAGEATFIENFALRIDRRGTPEDCFFTFNYGPVFDEHGHVVGMLDTVIETTAVVMAELRAREERERQQNLLQQMPGFVAVLSGPKHVFHYVNDAYIEICGPRPFIGRTLREVFPDLEGQGFFERLDRVFATGEPFSARAIPVLLDREGGNRHIDLLYEPIRDRAGHVQGIFVGGYDVTDRVHAEADLRQLNAQLEQRVNERTLAVGRSWHISPDLLCVLDAQGNFTATNPAFERTLGWAETELNRTGFARFVHPDDLESSLAAWSDMVERGQPVLRFENRWRTKAGGWRCISWVGIPEDELMYFIGRDITDEREQAQALANALEALRQSQKMEAVGQLTGGIAHDFNNLLAAISGSLQVMEMRFRQGKLDGNERYIEMGQRSVRRAAALTQRLLAFSRRQTLDPKPIDVQRLMEGMKDLIDHTVGPTVQVDTWFEPAMWPTLVDPSQLENALLNLCINARDAMPEGGRLTLYTANEVLDATQSAALDLSPGEYVKLCVADTGIGMSPAVAKRVFEPFFTTKPLGQGTGLGLSMVFGFVRQSGGQIHVESTEGQGTTLFMYLPRFRGDAVREEAPALREAPATGRGETILLIEDEDTVRQLLREVLSETGYTVVAVEDSATGLRLLQGDGRIDLLVTDVGLPGGMNGRQVADAGRVVRPHLKVLFITGYAESAAVGNGLMLEGMEVMTKPFEISGLVAKMRQMLADS
jgi:PAS domain S-box-containing protein